MERNKFNELFDRGYIEQYANEFFDMVNHVDAIAPTVVVEIGVKRAGTMRFWEYLIPKDGIVIGVDNNSDNLNYIANLPTSSEFLYHVTSEVGKELYYVIRDSNSKEAVADVKELLDGREIDFLFIDGGHYCPVPKTDFDNFNPLVRSGGLVCIADIGNIEHDPPVGGEDGTHEAWWNLPKEGKRIANMPHSHQGTGCGFWWKP